MIPRLLFLFLLLFFNYSIFGQQSSIVSSFRTEGNSCALIEKELRSLNDQRQTGASNANIRRKVTYLLKQSGALGCSFNRAYISEILGSLEYDNGLIPSAITYYLKALNYFKSKGLKLDEARVNNKIGVAYTFQGLYQKGLYYHLSAKQILERLNLQHTEAMADVYTNLSTVYEEENNSKKVFASLFEALKIFKKLNNDLGIADVYNNYGKYYLNKRKDINSAKNYFEKSFRIKNMYAGSISLAITSFNLGIIYLEHTVNLTKAAYFFSVTQQISRSRKNIYYEGMALQGLGEIERIIKNFSTSEQLLLKAINLQQKVQSLPELNMCYESMYKLYRDQLDYKTALKYKLKQIQINKELYNQQKTRDFLMLESKYKESEKDKTIAIVRKNQTIKELEIHYQQVLIFIILFVFSIIFLALWLYFRFTIRTRLLKSEKKNAIVTIKALNAQMNSHFIANTLISIKNFLSINDLEKSTEVMDKFSILMRNVLIKSQEELISLEEDLELLKVYLYLEEINHSHTFKWSVSVDPHLSTSTFFLPPMLVQPVVENIIKHGVFESEGDINISFSKLRDDLVILIKDNAKHIALNNEGELQLQGQGTKIIKERLELYNLFGKTNARITYNYLFPIGNQVKIIIPRNNDREEI